MENSSVAIASAPLVATVLTAPPAAIRDRIAAHLLDVAICGVLFSTAVDAVGSKYEVVAITTYASYLHTSSTIKSALVFALAALLYFFIAEAITGTTIGKRLCHLAVRRADRERPCGPIAAFIRTLLRPVDMIVGLPLLVLTATRQRFGDRIADTIVVDRRGVASHRRPAPDAPSVTDSAGWERRTKATMLDVTVLSAVVVAVLFAVGAVDARGMLRFTVSPALAVTLAAALFLYLAASEALLGGTLGQRASGLRVVNADSTPCGFAGSTLRTVCRPIDIGTMGIVSYILLRTSGRSLGDLLAATQVVQSDAPPRSTRSTPVSTRETLRTPIAIFFVIATAMATSTAATAQTSQPARDREGTSRERGQDLRPLISALLQKGCSDPDYHAVGGVPCWKLAAGEATEEPDTVLEQIGQETKASLSQLTQLTRSEDAMCARGVVSGRPGGASVGPATADQFASAIVQAARGEALNALQPGGAGTAAAGMMLSIPGMTQVQYHYQGLVNGPETRTFRIAGRVDGDLARAKLHLAMDGDVDGDKSLHVESMVNYRKTRSSFPTWSPFLDVPGDIVHSPVRVGLNLLSATATSRVTGRQRNGVPAWQEFEYSWSAEKVGGSPKDIVRSSASPSPEYANYPYGGHWVGVGWGTETRFRQGRKGFVGQFSRTASDLVKEGQAEDAIMSLNVKHQTVFYFHVDYDGNVSGRGTITYTLDPNLCGLAVLTRQVNERINFMKYLPSVFAATRLLSHLAVRRFQTVVEDAPRTITSRLDETLRNLPRIDKATGEAEITRAVTANSGLPKPAVRGVAGPTGTNYAIAEIEIENFAQKRLIAPGNGTAYPRAANVAPPTPKVEKEHAGKIVKEYAGRFKTRAGRPGWYDEDLKEWFKQAPARPGPGGGAGWNPQRLVVNNDRINESELRLLEDLANRLPHEAKGTIKLYTQRPPCSSCAGVIEQFSELFPQILLVVTSGG